MKIYFITSNVHKFHEVRDVVEPYGIDVVQIRATYPEIRADTCEEVVEEAVRMLSKKVKKKLPFIVEDSGLFIDALNGFPGVYSRFVYEKIGLEGILKLMKGKRLRDARFMCAIGYYDGVNKHIFKGSVEGRIATRIRGKSGFGYDPIFIPKGYKFSFAENMTLKSSLSHRRRALDLMLKILCK